MILVLLFSVQIYGQNWFEVAPIPALGRDDGLAFSVYGKGFIVTGNQSGYTESNKLFENTSETNSWQERSSFPGIARQYSSVFIIEQKAYVLGGYSEFGAALKDLWCYNSLTDSWQQLNDFPGIARWLATATSVNLTAYFGIGAAIDSTVSDFWKYNLSSDSWTQLGNYPAGQFRSVLGIPLLNSIICGQGFTYYPIAYNYEWYKFNIEIEKWSTFNSFPEGKRAYGTVVSNGQTALVIAVNDENNTFQNDVYSVDNFGSWKKREDIPLVGLRGAKGFYLKGEFYIASCLTESLSRISNVYKFNSIGIFEQESTVFPNPSSGNVTILAEPNSILNVFEANGKLVQSTIVSDIGYYELLDLPIGIYLVHIDNKTSSKIVKLVCY